MQTEDFLTYSIPRLIGQNADTSLAQIDSYVAENAIEFGAAVERGTDGSKQVKALSANAKFFGIAVRNEMRTEGNYPANTMVSVMTFGRIVVPAGVAVVAGDKATILDDGSFKKAGGTEIGVYVSNQDTVGGLVIVEIGRG